MLSNVQSIALVLFRDAHAGDHIRDLENQNRSEQCKSPRYEHADKLVADLAPVSVKAPAGLSAPKMGLITVCAKTPVSNAPIVPPAPCTPNASSASSYPKMALIFVTIR